MKSVIYVDVLLLVNFIISYFLLLAVGKLAGVKIRFCRMVSGCIASACFSLILIAPPLPEWVSFLYEFLSGAAVVLISFDVKSKALFFRLFLWYFLSNLGLAGLLLLAVLKGGFSGIEVNNLNIYLNLSPFVLAGSSLLFYGCMRLLVLLFGRPSSTALYPLTIDFDHFKLKLTAFYDTGFFLREPISESPVILVSFVSAQKKLPAQLSAFLTSYYAGEDLLPPEGFIFRILPCSFAGGQSLLPAFCASHADIEKSGQHGLVFQPVVAFCPSTLQKGSFDALFGNEILQASYKKERSFLCS